MGPLALPLLPERPLPRIDGAATGPAAGKVLCEPQPPPPPPLPPGRASLSFLPLSRAHVNAHASLLSNADTPRRAHARMRRPRIARAQRRRRGSPPPFTSACPPSRRPTAPAPPRAFFLGWGPTRRSRLRAGEAPRSPSTALCPSWRVTVTQPEGRVAWARAAVARLKAGSPGVRLLGRAGPTSAPCSGLPRARGRTEGAPSPELPSPCPPAGGPRAACPPSPGRPQRPRRGAGSPKTRGAPRCSGSAPPHPLLAAPKGQETGVACLSWAWLPRGSSGRLTRASTGTRHGSGLRDGPGAAAAGAPTAGPRPPGRWPCKPPLLVHAQVSAAPVPPAPWVGRDPAPGESGRPPRRGVRVATTPRAAPAAPGCGGRGRPGWEDVSSRCAQLRARVSDGAAAARAAPALPTNGLPRLDSCPTGYPAGDVDGAGPEEDDREGQLK
ncbi:uncharacterized protein LOC144293144 [Canis aureus]